MDTPKLRRGLDLVLLTADFAGTLLFAMEGALAGIRGAMDLFGILVLAFTTAVGGGIVRDLLIGATPPASIKDWRYGAIAFTGGMLAFVFHGTVAQQASSVLITALDAAGLSLFAIAGATKALEFGMHPMMAVLLGTITGCGGGTIRDIFLNTIPGILRTDIYASAALLGAAVMVISVRALRLHPSLAALAGGVSCFVLRMLSVWRGWSLPKIGA
jgi:uncharacterized membrane protein YeiH